VKGDQSLKENMIDANDEKGESIRWISTQLKMSPTTVQKVKNILSESENLNE